MLRELVGEAEVVACGAPLEDPLRELVVGALWELVEGADEAAVVLPRSLVLRSGAVGQEFPWLSAAARSSLHVTAKITPPQAQSRSVRQEHQTANGAFTQLWDMTSDRGC